MSIVIRDIGADDYPVIGWIVTGSLWPLPVRLFVNKEDAEKYAKDVLKEIKKDFGNEPSVFIEYRTSDCGLVLEQSYTQ